MRRSLAAPALVAVLVITGCGDGGGDDTPAACLQVKGVYLAALADAPGTVKLSAEVPISDCLTENQEAGALATVGTSMLEAATQLNSEARADPGGQANLELGYLIGAAVQGAEDTQGIHSELLRRLGFAARYSPEGQRSPAVILATFQKGFEAGLARG